MTDRLPVHCCCTPNRRLGYVAVPRGAAHVTFPVWTADRTAVERAITVDVGELWETAEMHDADGRLRRHRRQCLAVKSGHEPLEVWMRVPGFEADEGEWDGDWVIEPMIEYWRRRPGGGR